VDTNTLDLPEQYFDASIKNDLFDTLQDSELNLESFDPSVISDDYAMPEETAGDTFSPVAKQTNVDKAPQQPPAQSSAQDINPILSEIESIDNKIKDLESNFAKLAQNNKGNDNTQQLTEPVTTTEDTQGIVSVVNKNTFAGPSVPDQIYNVDGPAGPSVPDQIYNVDGPVNNSNSNFKNINQVEPDTYNASSDELINITNNKDTLLQEINQLNVVKENLLNKLYYNNKAQAPNVTNSNSLSESSVKVDNFTPNFADIDSSLNQSLERSINTENVFGDSPKLVKDSKGAAAVISKDQIDLKSAIEDHGGIDEAIADSVNQQTYVSNFADNGMEKINQQGSSFETLNNDTSNQFYNEPVLENNEPVLTSNNESMDIVKNTGDTVAAINALSKEFSNLSNAIMNGFNSLNGRMKETKTSQTFNQSNNTQQTANSYPSSAQSSEKDKSVIPNNIRGNAPLSDHFPQGFNLDNLGGSNLANRT
jgi:hypothetical protein